MRWHYTLTSSGILGEPRLQTHSSRLLQPLQPVPEPVHELKGLLLAETRLQALVIQGNVTFTNGLDPQQTTAVLPAASRETPGPTGGGGTKQSSRREFSHLSPGLPLKPRLFGRHRSFTFCFPPSFISCFNRTPSPDG